MTCKERLKECTLSRTATLATNFYNFETLKGLLMAAQKTERSLILQTSEGTLRYLGVKPAAAIARSLLAELGVEGWLHFDHGSDIDLVRECLDAGYDSVMIDASEKPMTDNIRITREVVKIAEPYNANVEAELGYIAKLGQQQEIEPTAVNDAVTFVEETGIDALAIAIGNAHGFYKKTPHLNFERLKEIRAATSCCLVLHGSSGIPDDQLRQAVWLGISKINLATETKNAFMRELQTLMRHNDEIDLRKVFPEAIEAVENLIVKKLEVISSIK